MSGYILCQTKKAKIPYYIENISTNVYSLEELCYYFYHNLYLVDETILNENLCRIHLVEDAFDVLVPTPGIHMVYNALAAAAVGRIYGLSIEEIKRGIESLETIRGRFKMIETDKFLVVDDCYNANPMSMKASLDVLHDGEGRRVAILGDMGELGENEIALHEEVGTHAAQCGIDVCICVGALSVHMAEAARKADPEFKVIYEKSRESLLEHLGDLVQEGDTILVKASHFMQFEEVVKALEEM